ncbi:MAG: hypothetical protein CME31_19865 [Gimesia sp.]|uniref:Uncharacterized protein n=1 Tax=Gimesia maris TaxID=122 RepID=A0A3D3RGK9_9PLAN|nr:hypothetical protein [Gimesia sp.]HCO27212.1 hypothetical protein [Gimesia maris]
MWRVSDFDLSGWFRSVQSFVLKSSDRIPVIEERGDSWGTFLSISDKSKNVDEFSRADCVSLIY